MKVESLKILLQQTAPGATFTLDPDALGIDAVRQLFQKTLPDATLTVTNAHPSVDALSLAGTMLLDGLPNVPAVVTFSSDDSKTNITGIDIDLATPGWTIATPFLNIALDLLQELNFSGLRMLLSAKPDPYGRTAPSIGLGSSLILTVDGEKKTLSLRGVLNPNTPDYIGLEGDFDTFSLADLAELSGLCTGVTFAVPAEIAVVAADLAVKNVSVAVNFATAAITMMAIDVQIAKQWTVVKDTFELESVTAGFVIEYPATTSPSLSLTVSAMLGVGPLRIDAAISIPDLVLSADLQDAADLTPFITQYLPGVEIANLAIRQFSIWLDLATKSYSGWIEIAESWSLVPGVAFSDLFLKISSEDGAVSGQLLATFTLGAGSDAADVLISAQYATGSGWTFSGSTVGNSQIPIGALMNGAASQFNITLPQPISKIALDKILLTLQTGSKDGANRKFLFNCEAKTEISGVTAALTLYVSLDYVPDKQQWDRDVKGTLLLPAPKEQGDTSFAFDVRYDDSPAGTRFRATYQGAALGFDQFAAATGFSEFLQIPPDLDLGLSSAFFVYDTAHGTMVFGASSSTYNGNAAFITLVPDDKPPRRYFLLINVNRTFSLSNLPLVGGELAKVESVSIDDLTIVIGSGLADSTLAGQINSLIASTTPGYPHFPDAGTTGDVLLLGAVDLGGAQQPISIALGGAAKTLLDDKLRLGDAGSAAGSPAALMPATAATAASGNAPDDGTNWFNVQRQIGIFQFNRIGVGYKSGELRFALDAGVALGPFVLSLDGLSISSPLTDFKPSFDISGLGLAYTSGPVEIAGALIKLPGSQLAPDVKFQFDGTIVVKAATFGISGIGSYAQLTSGAPSLFIFAQLDLPLGGPPPFFVTGLMAGFGFNRSLTIPEQDEVQEFPLLLLGQPPGPNQPVKAQPPMYVLQVLEGETAPAGFTAKKWIAPQPGALWFAIGINFTSFEIVQSKALLVIEPVGDFTLALLGLSTLQLPLPAESRESYAYVELQLRAVFQPMDGVFSASAFLSNNSYVITPACHLTGGFAFSLWFGSNPHAGDFVITLGGYHPAFSPPAHYPAVPRLGFNWAVSTDVTIKGDAYFALTPSCAMAGGGLEVMFHDGSLSAWFTAQADMLVSWRPFFYVASIDVSIGISYGLGSSSCQSALSISIAASVDLWGPPTGGRAQVHLVIVTFTVAFGADAAGQDQSPLDWTGMKSLLPDPKSMCTVTASAAVAGMVDNSASSSGKRWVVRPRGFSFDTASAIPASELVIEPPQQSAATLTAASGAATSPVAAAGVPARSIAIRPMNKSNVTSTHRVKVIRKDGAAVDFTSWTFTPRTQNMPEALWSTPPQPFSQIPATPSAKTIPGLMVGYSVSVPDPKPAAACGPIQLTELMEEYLSPPGVAPLSPAVVPDAGFLPSASTTTIEAIAALMSPTSVASRTTLFGLLAQSGIYKGKNEPLTNMAAEAAHLFSDVPMQQA